VPVTGIAGATAALSALLGAAVLVAIGAERLRVPYVVALVVFGAAIAAFHPVALPFHFGDTVLFVLLPPLIFEAAWNIDPAVLRRVGVRVAILAFPGVVGVVAAIAAAVTATSALAIPAALLLGVIVAPTDPVAVIAMFRRLHVPADLHAIVEGESIANDGIAIVLFGIVLAVVAGTGVPSVAEGIGRVLLAVIGGCAIGAAAALVLHLVVGSIEDRSIAVTGTVVLAFLSYLGSSALGLSGVFATACAAIVLRRLENVAERDQLATDVDGFWRAIAFVANAFVFLLTGLSASLERIAYEPLLVAVTIAAALLSRAVLAALVIRRRSWQVVVLLAGMRGGLSLALALSLPDDLPQRAAIVDAVFGLVLFTLVVQGLALEPVAKKLRL
jgi:monovalent cation:H+ antiporter, CPA1 family